MPQLTKEKKEPWAKTMQKQLESNFDPTGIVAESIAYMERYKALPWYKKFIHNYIKEFI